MCQLLQDVINRNSPALGETNFNEKYYPARLTTLMNSFSRYKSCKTISVARILCNIHFTRKELQWHVLYSLLENNFSSTYVNITCSLLANNFSSTYLNITLILLENNCSSTSFNVIYILLENNFSSRHFTIY